MEILRGCHFGSPLCLAGYSTLGATDLKTQVSQPVRHSLLETFHGLCRCPFLCFSGANDARFLGCKNLSNAEGIQRPAPRPRAARALQSRARAPKAPAHSVAG